MDNLSGQRDYIKIESKLKKTLLKEWDPFKIREIICKKAYSKKILKTWAKSIQPPEKYKWETKVEDNWLD